MEEEIMASVIGLVIGILVLAAGIYYLVKEGKNDSESRRIYTVITVIGGVMSAFCILLLVL